MPDREVVVVAEVPSLGSAIGELLASSGLGVAIAPTLGEAIRRNGAPGTSLPKVVVAAAAHRPSETARQWAAGPFASVPLVVVGSRMPDLPDAPRIHFVSLPLSPRRLLDLVQELAGSSDPAPDAPSGSPPPGPRGGVPLPSR